MDAPQTGLLERLRAQRESMQAASSASASPVPVQQPEESTAAGFESEATDSYAPLRSMVPSPTTSAERSALFEDHSAKFQKLETDNDDIRRRIDSVEANLRAGLAELRTELPTLMTAEISRHTTATNEAVTELGARVTRVETDFTRERERWSNVVTSFDQRLDQRLRSFRQDVTIMLTGMAVLVLAMLMLLLLRR